MLVAFFMTASVAKLTRTEGGVKIGPDQGKPGRWRVCGGGWLQPDVRRSLHQPGAIETPVVTRRSRIVHDHGSVRTDRVGLEHGPIIQIFGNFDGIWAPWLASQPKKKSPVTPPFQ